MGRILSTENNDDWTIRFLTDLRSHKIADLRHTPIVGLIFQNDADDAFASLTGAARLIEEVSEIQARWKEDAHARYFPTEKDRAYAGFIEVRIERMELWIRGVTPEPFGLHATILQRDPKGGWQWAT
jgi:general stress protein 26